MATSGRGSGMVGYNVQSAVDTKHHMIVTHEVTSKAILTAINKILGFHTAWAETCRFF